MKLRSILFSCLLGSVSVLSTQAIAGGTIGGDCCADLEERVAELEATTVRKGNRKVTLSISGNVHRGILFSSKSPTYAKDVMITDTLSYQSKFRLTGVAAISRDLLVGYRLEFGLSDGGSQEDGFQQANPLEMLHNDMLISSKTFGSLYIGHGNTASDFSGESDLSGTNYIAGGSVAHYNVGANIDGFSRQERVRYETPSIAGFKLSASWQENKNWDASLAYAGQLGDFSVVGKIAYYELGTDVTQALGFGVAQKGDAGVTGSISVLHNPTGLSLSYAAGEADAYAVTDAANIVDEFWYVKAGIQRKLIGAGKTYFSVDYHDISSAFGDVDKWGVQLVQDVDAAAMKVYASYWNADQKTNPIQQDVNEQALMIGVNIDF